MKSMNSLSEVKTIIRTRHTHACAMSADSTPPRSL